MSNQQQLTNIVYKDFNRHVKAFNKELITNFPHIDHFKLANASFYVCKKLNKKLPHKLFNKYIFDVHGKHILAKNDAYFISDQFSSSFWQSFADMIKTMWTTLDQGNKDAIWEHMLTLCALNKRCLDYKRNKNKTPEEPESSGDENL